MLRRPASESEESVPKKARVSDWQKVIKRSEEKDLLNRKMKGKK